MKPKQFARLVLNIHKARQKLVRCSRTANHRPDIHHEWGDTDCDWNGINEAAGLIHSFCWRYGRFYCDTKEKYGTVRCSPYTTYIKNKLLRILFGWALRRYQEYVLKIAYRQALKKYPHLALEILCNQPFKDGLLVEYDWHFYKKRRKKCNSVFVRKGMRQAPKVSDE